MTSLLALLASALWGTADFMGGRLSRRASPIWVVAASQLCSLGIVTVAAVGAVAVGMRPAGTGWLAWGVAGGASLAVALVSFYRRLSVGRMGVVAPIASTGVVVPVVVGLIEGDRLSPLQALGIAVAIVGVVLASRPASDAQAAPPGSGHAVGLALLAGLGFGSTLVCLDRGAASSGLGTLWVMRVVIVLLLAGPAWRSRPVAVDRRTWGTLGALGVCDAGSNAAFTVASAAGELALVSVLSSLYPAVTTLLARELLHERLSPAQLLGVAATIGGTVLIVV